MTLRNHRIVYKDDEKDLKLGPRWVSPPRSLVKRNLAI